jgi:hypothetical protein
MTDHATNAKTVCPVRRSEKLHRATNEKNKVIMKDLVLLTRYSS